MDNLKLALNHGLKEEERMATKRTTQRSSSGKKYYAVRDKKGRFVGIKTYKRAHRRDVKRKSKAQGSKQK